MDDEKIKAIAAFIKLYEGQPNALSFYDIELIFNVLGRLRVDVPSTREAADLKNKMINNLEQWGAQLRDAG